MKTKKGIITALVCLALIGITGFSYAAIVSSTDTTKDVSTSNLDISLVQTSEDGQEVQSEDGVIGFDYGKVAPGTTIDESMAVRAGDSSKDTYVRVTVTRYWSKDGIKSADSEFINPASIELNANSSDWIKVEDPDDLEVVYFYYRLPLSANQVTSNLVDGFTLLADGTENSNKYSGYSSHIDFFAEGVQVLAGKDAMLAEWGVEATIGNNNEIIDIVEQ